MNKTFTLDDEIKLSTTFGSIFVTTTTDYPCVMRANIGENRDFSITICKVSDNNKGITFSSVYRYRADMEEYHGHFGDLDQTIQEIQGYFEDYSAKIVDKYERKLNALKEDIKTVSVCENGMDNITMFEGFNKKQRYCTGVNAKTKYTYIIIDNPYYTYESYLISEYGTSLSNRYIEQNSFNDIILINLPRKEYDLREGNIDDILEKYK